MAEIEFFHFRASEGYLFRMNTAVKYFSAIILTIGIMQSSAAELLPLSVILCPIALFSTGRAFSAARLLGSLRSFRWFLLFLAAIAATRGMTEKGTPFPPLPFFSIEGLASGGLYSWKLLVLLIMGQMLLSTTDPSRLQGALYSIMRRIPFVPAGRIATMISLTLTFIPLIFDQYLEIHRAVESRLGSHSSNPLKKIVTIALPLMQSTLARADEVADAMESRCYCDDPAVPRWPAGPGDFAVLIISFLITATIFLLN